MAGIQWSGGQHAGAKAAKTALRHNDKEQRLVAAHSNEEIDKTLTPGNWSVIGGSYEDKYRRYDERLAQVMEGVRVSSGANENNTLQVCIVYEPQGPDGTRLSRKQVRIFYGNVYQIACELFGKENVIGLDVHVDEQHDYVDPVKGKTGSRIHGHLAMVPAVPFAVKTTRVPVLDADGNPIQLTDKETGEPLYYVKDDPLGDDEHGYRWRKGDPKVKTRKVVTKEPLPDGEYRLNWNAFASRENIIEFNRRVHEMCQREFGMDYITGEGKHAGRTVEQMKRESRIAAAEAVAEHAEAKSEAAIARAADDVKKLEQIRGAGFEHDGVWIPGLESIKRARDEMRAESEMLDKEIAQKTSQLEKLDGEIDDALTSKKDIARIKSELAVSQKEYLELDTRIRKKREEYAELQELKRDALAGYADSIPNVSSERVDAEEVKACIDTLHTLRKRQVLGELQSIKTDPVLTALEETRAHPHAVDVLSMELRASYAIADTAQKLTNGEKVNGDARRPTVWEIVAETVNSVVAKLVALMMRYRAMQRVRQIMAQEQRERDATDALREYDERFGTRIRSSRVLGDIRVKTFQKELERGMEVFT